MIVPPEALYSRDREPCSTEHKIISIIYSTSVSTAAGPAIEIKLKQQFREINPPCTDLLTTCFLKDEGKLNKTYWVTNCSEMNMKWAPCVKSCLLALLWLLLSHILVWISWTKLLLPVCYFYWIAQNALPVPFSNQKRRQTNGTILDSV